jgi:hypothetical protein
MAMTCPFLLPITRRRHRPILRGPKNNFLRLPSARTDDRAVAKVCAFMATGILLFVIMLWATSPVIVIPLSLATGSVIMWVFFWIRGNPNIIGSLKRASAVDHDS